MHPQKRKWIIAAFLVVYGFIGGCASEPAKEAPAQPQLTIERLYERMHLSPLTELQEPTEEQMPDIRARAVKLIESWESKPLHPEIRALLNPEDVQWVLVDHCFLVGWTAFTRKDHYNLDGILLSEDGAFLERVYAPVLIRHGKTGFHFEFGEGKFLAFWETGFPKLEVPLDMESYGKVKIHGVVKEWNRSGQLLLQQRFDEP